jgi:hypothetical protein
VFRFHDKRLSAKVAVIDSHLGGLTPLAARWQVTAHLASDQIDVSGCG